MRYIREIVFNNGKSIEEITQEQYSQKAIVNLPGNKHPKLKDYKFYKDWTEATDEEISKMSFDEAVDMIVGEIAREGEIFGPCKHFSQALRIALNKALCKSDGRENERRSYIKMIEKNIKRSGDPMGSRRLRQLYSKMYTPKEWQEFRQLYDTVSRRRIVIASPIVFQRFTTVVKEYIAQFGKADKLFEGVKNLCKETGIKYCDVSVSIK